uniref:Uncharacterized protein n=1 Tax=viral metagenome TaxID=1070528 RepID=A0A6M3JHG5_9ZZZZ
MRTKPENIGTFPDGNAIWNDYKTQTEVLEHYTEALSRAKEEGDQFMIDLRERKVAKYEKQIEGAERKLIDFCKSHNISL